LVARLKTLSPRTVTPLLCAAAATLLFLGLFLFWSLGTRPNSPPSLDNSVTPIYKLCYCPPWLFLAFILPLLAILFLLVKLWRNNLLALSAGLSLATGTLLAAMWINTLPVSTFSLLYWHIGRGGFGASLVSGHGGLCIDLCQSADFTPRYDLHSPNIQLEFTLWKEDSNYPVVGSLGSDESILTTSTGAFKKYGVGWRLSSIPRRRHDLQLLLPYPALVAPFLALPLFWLFRTLRARRRKSARLCPTCSYDLRAHGPKEKCPECGTVIAA